MRTPKDELPSDAAEETVSYRCDGPTTRRDRQQMRARARVAVQEKLKQEEAEKITARRLMSGHIC